MNFTVDLTKEQAEPLLMFLQDEAAYSDSVLGDAFGYLRVAIRKALEAKP
jgi:hypothetical protein